MKTKLLIIAGLALSIFAQKGLAQDTNGFTDVKGMNFLNAGIGLGTYGMSGTGGLPINASFEHGFTKNISAGGGISYVQKKYGSYWKYSYLVIGARGSYHLNEALKISKDNLDVYAGAGLLYRHYKFKYTEDHFEIDPDNSGGDVVIELHAGARYYFKDKIGAFAELGYGISPLQLGVTVKL
jgi:hypothetical protein